MLLDLKMRVMTATWGVGTGKSYPKNTQHDLVPDWFEGSESFEQESNHTNFLKSYLILASCCSKASLS